jgi:hypothetical protein
MATAFKNTVIPEIGTTPTQVIQTGASARVTIIGFSMTNLLEEAVQVSVLMTDTSSTTAYFIKETIIPPFQTLRAINGGEKLILMSDNEMKVVSTKPDSVDVVVSYVEIT